MKWMQAITILALVGLLSSGALLAGEPSDGTEGPATDARQAVLAQGLGVLRARLESRLAQARVLEGMGRPAEALDILRGMDLLYEKGLEDLHDLLNAAAAPAPELVDLPLPAASPAPRRRPTARGADAIDEALRWLAAHQSPNGAWEAAGFGQWCDGKPQARGPDGAGKDVYDVGTTGLALCAFLGAGYTNRGNHPFAKVVSRGLRYLKNVQDPEGCFGPRTSQHFIYNHATASMAMVEAYGMTESPLFKSPAQKALDFIALARNPYFAWRYGVKPGDNDTSVSGWMLMALKSAQAINKAALEKDKPAPLVIDDAAFDGMRAWLDKMTDADYGRVGYIQRGGAPARPQDQIDRFPGEKSEAMTAVGLLARVFLGEDPRRSDMIKKGAQLLEALPPVWNPSDGSIDMYYWFYGSLAAHQVGGRLWKTWNEALKKQVMPNQRRDTTYCLYRGSWDPIGPWGPDGGRVYATALMAMCMETCAAYNGPFASSSR